MSLIIEKGSSSTEPTAIDLVYNGTTTSLSQVDVVKNGVRTTVWTSAQWHSFSVSISKSIPLSETTYSASVSGLITGVPTRVTFKVYDTYGAARTFTMETPITKTIEVSTMISAYAMVKIPNLTTANQISYSIYQTQQSGSSFFSAFAITKIEQYY